MDGKYSALTTVFDLLDIIKRAMESGRDLNEVVTGDSIEFTMSELVQAFPEYELENSTYIEVDNAIDDSMDGDMQSGLASAGFGMDEDYCCNQEL